MHTYRQYFPRCAVALAGAPAFWLLASLYCSPGTRANFKVLAFPPLSQQSVWSTSAHTELQTANYCGSTQAHPGDPPLLCPPDDMAILIAIKTVLGRNGTQEYDSEVTP